MFVATFVDAGRVDVDLAHFAVDLLAIRVPNFERGARDHRPVAFVEVGDGVGQRRKRNCIRPNEHLTSAVTDGEGAALACRDQQIFFAFKQQTERIGPV